MWVKGPIRLKGYHIIEWCFIFGYFLCNVMNLLPQQTLPPKKLLIAKKLSSCDVILCFTQLKEVHPMLVPYLIPVLHMAITGSDYLNLAAAVERYLATDRNFR